MSYTREEAYEASLDYFRNDNLAADVFVNKYALKDTVDGGTVYYEKTPDDMHRRLSSELNRIEEKYENPLSKELIFDLIKDFKYIIPQGSPMSGIGNVNQVLSLSNCFVVGNPADSYGSIMQIDEEQIQLMKRRGGVGHDLSHIRPAGLPVKNSALTSTGLVPFMDRYSNSTNEVAQGGRRGALMLTCSINHPDSEDFIDAKLEQGKVTGANISVKISDDFMKAAMNANMFTQLFPIESKNPILTKEIDAQRLWKKIIHNAWKSAEPGILFWDTIMRESVPDCYQDKGFTTISTNPCGEITLCPYDSCRLLAINLYGYVENPFTKTAYFNWDLFKQHVIYAERLMDDIVDLEIEKIDMILDKIESDPEDEKTKRVEIDTWLKIKDMTLKGRRTGLGVTAEGDMLAALGFIYGTKEATDFSTQVHKTLAINAYKSSAIMAKERGSFPVYEYDRELNNPFINRLKEADSELYWMLKEYGRRNIALLTIAPTGSVSIMTQTTSGIEPAYLVSYKRRRKINPTDKSGRVDFIDAEGVKWEEYNVFHHKFETWLEINGYNIDDVKAMKEPELKEIIEKSPYYKATSNDVDWVEKVRMQGEVQKWVDHSISVTVNLPNDVTEEIVSKVYETGWKSGCFTKGHSVYTSNGIKDISNISIGDIVISDDGKEHVVDDVYNLPIQERKFANIKASGMEEITCTIEHPILVLEMNNTDYKKSFYERNKKIVWKNAGDLKVGDHILSPREINISKIINTIKLSDYIKSSSLIEDDDIFLSRELPWKKDKFVKSANSRSLKNVIKINEEFSNFLGWFIAEGHYSSTSCIRLNFNLNEKNECDRIEKYLQNEFDIKTLQYVTTGNGGQSLRLEFHSKILSEFLENVVGRKSINKHLPIFYTSLSKENLKILLDSYYKGDAGVTVSQRLARELFMANLIIQDRPYFKPNYTSTYYVGSSKSNISLKTAKPFDNFLCYRVNKVDIFNSNEKVYNFSVSEKNTYIVNGIIVHNCKGITVYRDGSRQGVIMSNEGTTQNVVPEIKENNAKPRPKKLECEVVRFTNNKEKWIGFLGLDVDESGEKYPYELFTGLADKFYVPNAIEKGEIVRIKEKKTDKSRYDFVYVDKDGYKVTMEGLNRAFDREFWNTSKLLSAFLRHRIHLPSVINLIDSLQMDSDAASFGTWKSGVKRIIKKYINSTISGESCPECKSTDLTYESGCKTCKNCGWSKCE